MRGTLILGFLVPLAAATAQSTAPAHFSNAEGNFGYSNGPGNPAHQTRFMQLAKAGAARQISRLKLRRDANALQVFPEGAVIADIYLSHAARTYFNQSPTFDVNHGADRTQVATLGTFVFPQTEVGPVPHAFDYHFPFDQPFSYRGGKVLCWEIQTHYRTMTNTIVLDAAGNWDDQPQPVVSHFGTGCTATGYSSPVQLLASGSAQWNQMAALNYTGSNLPPDSSALLMFGVDTTQFAGIPLPFTLPATTFQGSSGPCTFYNDIAAVAPVQVDSSGNFSAQMTWSLGGVANGSNVFSQIIGLDPGANVYGTVLSNCAQIHMVRPFGTTQLIGHIFLNGSLGPVGTSQQWQGLVARI